MTLPINLFFWFVCIVPIFLLLVLMVLFQWGASKAAPFTLMITCILGLTLFKADLNVLSSELLKASWSSLGIILVILAAILLYEIGTEASAFVVLNHLFTRLAPNELIRVFMIGISFASFLQGITGFCVPVLIVAPLLLTMGVAPLYAVIIPLLGHSWAGTFGTLALGWEALFIQTAVVDRTLILNASVYASVLLFVLTGLFNLVIAFMYGRKKAVKKGFMALTTLALVHGLGQLVVALVIPELAVIVPSILSLVALTLLSRTSFYREEWRIEESPIMIRLNGDSTARINTHMTAKQALLPYVIMTSLSIIVLVVEPLRTRLSSFQWGPSFSRTQTGYGVVNPVVNIHAPLTLFTHVSFFLLVTCLVTYFYYRKKGLIKNPCFSQLTKKASEKTISPGLAIFSLLCISRVMAGTGQTFVLATGIAMVLKEKYVLISPFIGLLGSFITGSNMTSNILFGDFQLHASEFIGLKTSLILGAQTAGGAIGTSIAPGNIILGTTTAGILGFEGRVLIKLIPYTLIAATLFGLVLYIDFKWF